MNTTLVCSAVLFAAATALTAQDMDGSQFRALEDGDWYHPVEPETLVYHGADRAELTQILARIETADGTRTNPEQPDTIAKYGPGNWVYEFTLAGDKAMAEGRYDAAVTYYHTGAAPHTGADETNSALEKARDAYAKGIKGIARYEEIQIEYDGESFTGHLNLPDGDGPFPVLVFSNGSDMSSVVTMKYFTQHLMPKGIAFLTLDLPGMGRSAAYDMADGQSEKLHVAAIQWAKTDTRLDARNVFAQGVSFGGHAAARLWTQHQDLDLAGVIYICGPLHAPFLAPPHVYAELPAYTIDGVKTRVGLAQDASLETFAEAVDVFAIGKSGAFDAGPISTPLLAVNSHNDPVAPLDEMAKMAERGSQVEQIVFYEQGHCPPHKVRQPIVAAWIESTLR